MHVYDVSGELLPFWALFRGKFAGMVYRNRRARLLVKFY